MKIQPTLLADLEAFLSLCSNGLVRCVGQCISRTALPHIARCLASPPPLAQWRTARDCSAVHHLHAIAQLAGLVQRHPRTKQLELTPRAFHWLNQSAAQQLSQLQRAFANPVALQTVWLQLKLPGHELVQPDFAFEPLLALCAAKPTQKTGSPSPRRIAAVAQVLADSSTRLVPSAQAITSFATALFGLHQQLHAAQASVVVQGNLVLRVEPGKEGWQHPHPVVLPIRSTLSAHQRHALASIALLQHTTRSGNAPHSNALHRHYHLDPNYLRRAWQNGLSLRHIRDQLEDATGGPLPALVVWQVRHWERQWRDVQVYPATLLEVSDPAILEKLTRSRPIRDCIARTLSPRTVIVRAGALPRLLRRLHHRGLQPSVSGFAQGDDARGGQTLDQPDLAHAYISALLFHHLADHAPVSYRPPFAAIEALARALNPHDYALAQAMLADALADLERQRSPLQTSAQPLPATISTMSLADEERWVAQLQTDIQTGAQRQITYRAANGQHSQRTVTPLRIEWHAAVPYLIAFCHQAQDERTFRIDRIQQSAISGKR